MEAGRKKLPIAFYRSASGAEPVRSWLKSLPIGERRTVGYDIALVEFGWPVGMPLCRPFGGGRWEIRSSLGGNRIARVIFCVADERMVLLHGFIKKSQKTPQSELTLARDRQRDVGR
jgi:phage-related protein